MSIVPPTERRVLITGLTGQDGYYLAHLLIEEGNAVAALVPAAQRLTAQRLTEKLGPIEFHETDITDEAAVMDAVASFRPEIVYHLAALSSVGKSWRDPVLTARTNSMGTLYLLEALRRHAPQAGFVLAGSCDCFDHGAVGPDGLTPAHPFLATNPYAVSKVMAHQMTRCYREEFGMRASVAILFNHTSPRRPEHFVERAIISRAVAVAEGRAEKLKIGSLDTRRDWAWAPDLMNAFARMGNLAQPQEIVLASGRLRTTGDWVQEACRQLGLDAEEVVEIDRDLVHPGDRPHTFGNIEAAERLLGWRPTRDLPEMVEALIRAERVHTPQ